MRRILKIANNILEDDRVFVGLWSVLVGLSMLTAIPQILFPLLMLAGIVIYFFAYS